jgi:cobalt-zinc-cadmium efflux system membrane fusion protein
MRRPSLLSVLLPFCVALVPGCDAFRSHSHEHETHPAEAEELEPETVTVFGERALLFMEFPPLVRGSSARFLAHFTVLANGEPVRAGRVALEIGPTTLVADAPKRDGLFVPEGAVAEAGTHRAKLTVTSEQVEEVLELGEIRVFADEAAARAAAASAVAAEKPNEIGFLLEQQWKVKLMLAEARPRELAKELSIPATTRAPERARAVVSPPAAGRLLAPTSGPLARTGERVEARQLLGWIEPPLSASDLAQLRALELEVELRVLETTRAVLEARARLLVAERELERVGELGKEGLSTRPRLDLAEQGVSVARSDLEAAQSAAVALERVTKSRSERGDDGESGLRLELRAPIAGTIVSTAKSEGEIADIGDELFEILDTSTLWIEGRVSEFDLPVLSHVHAAHVSFPALESARLEIHASALANAYISPTLEPESRTFALRYEVPNPRNELKHGMLARLFLATERVSAAVAIPAEAIVMDQGLPTAYVMVSGETFERRDLELGLRDGGLVEVRAGIAAGERVATRAAHLVRLASLSPASFGAGHAH